MKSAFAPTKGEWNIGWPGRVARYDLVYQSPPDDPTQGFPLGNGDVGVLVWTEGSKVVFVLNKCDLWDDAPAGRRQCNWALADEDCCTALRHAGRIILDFGVPVCDVFYLSDFQGRLSLADATMSFSACGPLGSITLTVFVGHDDGILCADVECSFPEAVGIEITVERTDHVPLGIGTSRSIAMPTSVCPALTRWLMVTAPI